MSGYSVTINGKKHRVTIVNGKSIYDPPLDESRVRRDRKNMRQMLKNRTFPGVNTDTTFLAGFGSLEKQFGGDEVGMRETVEAARAQGYNPGPFDVYLPTVAKCKGDPDAWLKAGEGTGKIRDVCEKRGVAARGKVNTKGRGPERDYIKEPRKKLADDLVEKKIKEYRKNPEFSKKSKAELREMVIDKHSNKL